MRICFVLPVIEYFSPVSGGAVATVTRHLARELEQLGHEVSVVTPDDAQPLYADGRVFPVHMQVNRGARRLLEHARARLLGWAHPQQEHYWECALEIVAREKPDVVVLANDLVGAHRVRRVLPEVRVVCWLHNECTVSQKQIRMLEQNDLFVCCSEYVRRWFLREYRRDASRVFTVHAGVDHTAFTPRGESPVGGPLRLLFVGRLDPNKGVDLAVECARRFRQRALPVELTVVGHTWFYKRSCAASERYLVSLRDGMREAGAVWTGHVPRDFLPEVIRRHDVALVLSRSQEPFGLVVLEAMASGLAVVASFRGGLREACGGAARIVDPENIDGIMEVLLRFHHRREELAEWKLHAIQRAERARWGGTAGEFLGALGETRAGATRK